MPRPPSDRPYVCGPYKHHRQFRLVIYTPGSGGRRSSYRRYFETEAQAKTWKREFRRQIAAAGRTVGDAVAEFIDAHLRRQKGNKESSITTSRYRLAALLDFDMALADLNKHRAQELYDDMLEEGFARRGKSEKTSYANDTHHNSLREARTFCAWCMKKSWMSSNPFEDIEKVGKKNRRKKQLRVDEARTFTRHCLKAWTEGQDRTAIAALLPLQFNLRASEVANLIARDVDDNGRLLWVAFNENELTGEDEAKTESSKRTVGVPPHLVPVMRWLASHPATETGHLFAKESGKPADRHWVRYWALEHAKEAGTPPITTHGLRGTHASMKRAEGHSAEEIAADLGHNDRGATANRHYIDPAVAADAQGVAVAETIYDGIPIPTDPEPESRTSNGEHNQSEKFPDSLSTGQVHE